MITLVRAAFQEIQRNDEYRGLSTDPKPTEDVSNGSVLYCMDTKEVFMFDESTKSWLLQ